MDREEKSKFESGQREGNASQQQTSPDEQKLGAGQNHGTPTSEENETQSVHTGIATEGEDEIDGTP